MMSLMLKAYTKSLLLSLALFVVSQVSHAQADLFEIDVTSRLQINYDPFSGLAGTESLSISLKKSPVAEQSEQEARRQRYQLRIQPSDLGSNLNAIAKNGRELPVTLQSNNSTGRLERFNNQFSVGFSLDERSINKPHFDFSLSIAPSIFADADRYILPLEIDVVEFGSEEIVVSARRVDLEVVVAPKLQTSLSGTSASYGSDSKFSLVDFDVLETNETKQIFLQVRGNSQAHITISSENHGRLRHLKHNSSFIDYSINVDGRGSNLKSPLELTRSVARDFKGSNYPITIRIGDVSGVYAGSYKDIITINIEPQ